MSLTVMKGIGYPRGSMFINERSINRLPSCFIDERTKSISNSPTYKGV